jgi:hypothetical protein
MDIPTETQESRCHVLAGFHPLTGPHAQEAFSLNMRLRQLSRFAYGCKRPWTLAISLVFLTMACHSGPRVRPQSPQGDQYLIMAAELEASKQLSLYDAVRQLRPFWLTRSVRGRTGENTIAVYVDDQLLGNASALRRISVFGIENVRYMSATEAQTRFGQNNGGRAAILVESARSESR